MDEQRKPRFAPPAVGGISLLAVFAVLCLTIFALLSLSTVRADTRLAEVSTQAVADYYAADCAAQEILARMRSGAGVPEDLDFEVSVAHYEDRAETTYTYSCPISDTQSLEVQVQLNGEDWRILRWQAVPAGEWELNDELSLWDGTGF